MTLTATKIILDHIDYNQTYTCQDTYAKELAILQERFDQRDQPTNQDRIGRRRQGGGRVASAFHEFFAIPTQ